MTTVTHQIFGKGQVVKESKDSVTVNFNGTEKTLLIKFANLTNENGSKFVIKTTKAKTTPKKDFSKYSDSELLEIRNGLFNELIDAKNDVAKDNGGKLIYTKF